MFFELNDQLGHAWPIQDADIFHGKNATRDEGQIVEPRREGDFLERLAPMQVVHEANVIFHVEDAVLRRPAKIGVNDDHIRTALGVDIGEIAEGRALSFAGATGDERVSVRAVVGEVQLDVALEDSV